MYLKLVLLIFILIKVSKSTPVLPSISGLINKPVYSKVNQKQMIYGINGGHNITIKKANYVGSICDRGTGHIIATAIVIDHRWILTAAYPVYKYDKKEIVVRLGSSSSREKGKLFNIQEIIKHPQYTADWDFDIALVKLTQPIPFHNTMRKISIASSVPMEGTKVAVSGFGYDEFWHTGPLKQAIVPIISYESCKEKYEPEEWISSRSLCTAANGTGPCFADYGGPLVYKKRLIGVFSGTYDCTGVSYPAVYADASQYRNWILETIKNNTINK